MKYFKIFAIVSALIFILPFSCSKQEPNKSVMTEKRSQNTAANRPSISEKPTQNTGNSSNGQSTDDKIKAANESISDSFREHGTNSVLKTSDKLNQNEMTHGKYKINEPDYDIPPRPIEFKSLKKVYTYFRLKEKLPEPVLESLNGSLVTMVGAVMPFEKIPEDGKFSTFWLSNPAIVLKGCVFCNPPTMGDIVYAYKNAGEKPFEFDREKLFKQVLLVRVTGRFFFGPDTINNQTFLNSILVTDIEILN